MTNVTTITNWASINPEMIQTVENILNTPSVNTNDLTDPEARFRVKPISNSGLITEVENITGQQECAYQVFYPQMNNVLLKSHWGEGRSHCFCYIIQSGGEPLTISFYDEPTGWDQEIKVVTPEEQVQFTFLESVDLEENKWYNIKETKWWKLTGLNTHYVSLYFSNDTMNSSY